RLGHELDAAAATAAVLERAVDLLVRAAEVGRLELRDVYAQVPRYRQQVRPVHRGRDVQDDDRVRTLPEVRVPRAGVGPEQQEVQRAEHVRVVCLVGGPGLRRE